MRSARSRRAPRTGDAPPLARTAPRRARRSGTAAPPLCSEAARARRRAPLQGRSSLRRLLRPHQEDRALDAIPAVVLERREIDAALDLATAARQRLHRDLDLLFTGEDPADRRAQLG